MKGLSVILTMVLMAFALWLPGRLKASGKLPAEHRGHGTPAATGFANGKSAAPFVRL